MSGRFSFFLPAGRGLLGAPECRAWAADSRRAQLPGAANYRRWVGKPLDTLSPRSWPAAFSDPVRSWVEKPLDTLPPRCCPASSPPPGGAGWRNHSTPCPRPAARPRRRRPEELGGETTRHPAPTLVAAARRSWVEKPLDTLPPRCLGTPRAILCPHRVALCPHRPALYTHRVRRCPRRSFTCPH